MYPYLKVTVEGKPELVRADVIVGVYERDGGGASLVVTGDRLDIMAEESYAEIEKRLGEMLRRYVSLMGGKT